MKNRAKLLLLLLAALLLAVAPGCQLAREDAGAGTGEDRQVGVLLTTEYLDLFDFEGYMNDNFHGAIGGEIRPEQAQEYQGRVYAVAVIKTVTNEETGETVEMEGYQFPGVDGIHYFAARHEDHISTESDEAISDGHVAIHHGDEENSVTMEGTIYVAPDAGHTYYFNPVYQSADGRVYAMSGSGYTAGGVRDEGETYAQTLSATRTVTRDGQAVTDTVTVQVTISVMYPPEQIVILQMDKDNVVVSREAYAPGAAPEAITPEESTVYLIMETHKRDMQDKEIVMRALYGKEAGTLEMFALREDGVCVQQWAQVLWEE